MSGKPTWSQFVISNKKDNSLIKVSVQKLTDDLFEESLDFYMNHFVKDEIAGIPSGVTDNPEAMQECRELKSDVWRMPAVLTLVYLVEDETKPRPEIVGVSSLILEKKGDQKNKSMARTEEMKKYIETFDTVADFYPLAEILERYGVDCISHGIGLAVHPKYRGMGIATYHFNVVRRQVCYDQGVPLCFSWLTSVATQRACERSGWETLCEVPFHELGSRLGVRYENAPSHIKLMATRARSFSGAPQPASQQ